MASWLLRQAVQFEALLQVKQRGLAELQETQVLPFKYWVPEQVCVSMAGMRRWRRGRRAKTKAVLFLSINNMKVTPLALSEGMVNK
jgi:hypothetical protein